jgi:hypothetical protein
MATETNVPPVRLWGSDAVVLMDVHAGVVRVQVAGHQWESGVSFTVPIERLRKALAALEAVSYGRQFEAESAVQLADGCGERNPSLLGRLNE